MTDNVTEKDLAEIREQIDTLEIEIQLYRNKLTEYEKGEMALQTVLEWIDNTEVLHRL